MVGPAFAVDNTQTVTGTLESSIGAITNGDRSLTLLPGATATNTTGTVTVNSNLSYDLSVVADQANMTKWAGTTPAYVTGTALAAALQAQTTTVGKTLKNVPSTGSLLSLETAQPAAGDQVFHMTLSQPVGWTDPPATYRIVLTYTAASAA